ncbi:MAG: hypothetical protein ACRDL7_15780, partial [Gaiellaceae bacterium]
MRLARHQLCLNQHFLKDQSHNRLSNSLTASMGSAPTKKKSGGSDNNETGKKTIAKKGAKGSKVDTTKKAPPPKSRKPDSSLNPSKGGKETASSKLVAAGGGVVVDRQKDKDTGVEIIGVFQKVPESKISKEQRQTLSRMKEQYRESGFHFLDAPSTLSLTARPGSPSSLRYSDLRKIGELPEAACHFLFSIFGREAFPASTHAFCNLVDFQPLFLFDSPRLYDIANSRMMGQASDQSNRPFRLQLRYFGGLNVGAPSVLSENEPPVPSPIMKPSPSDQANMELVAFLKTFLTNEFTDPIKEKAIEQCLQCACTIYITAHVGDEPDG